MFLTAFLANAVKYHIIRCGGKTRRHANILCDAPNHFLIEIAHCAAATAYQMAVPMCLPVKAICASGHMNFAKLPALCKAVEVPVHRCQADVGGFPPHRL